MKSIAEIFDNSKDLLESITNFIDKYIGTSLLFLPFSQTLLTTRDDKLMVGPNVPVDRRTVRGRRRAAAKDLICTMELLAEKANTNSFSKSEQEFFCSVRDFKKNYLKPLLKKHL